VYAVEALLACLWQLWQVFEKPSLAQIEDQVGAVPEGGAHPVPASNALPIEAPLELELLLLLLPLPLLDDGLLLPLLEPKPLPALLEPPLLTTKPASEPPSLLEVEVPPVEPPSPGPRKLLLPLLPVELEPLVDWLVVVVPFGSVAPLSVPSPESASPSGARVGGSLASAIHPTIGTQPSIAATTQ
jgi:hypothetical protein